MNESDAQDAPMWLEQHHIEDLDAAALDAQPFGIIQLDHTGHILKYNLYEEQLAQRRREDVIGKHFFFEVAPCTRVRAFYGRFRDAVSTGQLRATFNFVFALAHGERHVTITMEHSARDQSVWVLVQG